MIQVESLPPTLGQGVNPALMDYPPLIQHFPLQLNDTCWGMIDAECELCNQIVPHENLRGSLYKFSQRSASVEAACLCTSCNHVTAFSCRLHDDGSISSLEEKKWVTVQYEESFLDKFISSLKSIYTKIIS